MNITVEKALTHYQSYDKRLVYWQILSMWHLKSCAVSAAFLYLMPIALLMRKIS